MSARRHAVKMPTFHQGILEQSRSALTRVSARADNTYMDYPKDSFVEMTVRKLMVDSSSHVPILILSGEDTSRFLPIWIGLFEANAIATALEERENPRPMTHDLALNLIESMQGSLVRILINDLAENTFYAKLIVDVQGNELVVDSRPSDAVALAVRADVPIWVSEDVVQRASKEDLSQKLRDDERLKKWLEDVDPEDLGKYEM